MVRDKNFYKTIFRISLPAAFSSLVSFLVVVADDIMVSHIGDGTSAQSAVSQVNALTAFYTATLLGLVSGSAVLISQYWGKRDMERIKKIFSFVFLLSIGVSLLFVLIAQLFPSAILRLVIDSSQTEVTSLALQYFAIVCFSWIPFAVTNSLSGMLRSVEVVRVTLYVSICSLFVNIALNYILIFGKLGLPEMGVQGAAVATLITRVIEMAIVWVYTFHHQKVLSIKPGELFKTDSALSLDYVKYGLPVGLTDMQWATIGMLKAAIIGQMGKVFITANSITNSMMNLGTMFTFALAGGACVVVGKAVGKGDYDTAREYSKTIQIMFAIIAVVMALIVFLLRAPFTSMYGSSADPEVHALCLTMIAIGALTLLGTSYHAACFVGINRGAGDSRFVAKVDMICGWLIVLPATLLAAFVFHWPLPIVFLMTRIDQCFKWIIAFFRLRGNKWIKNVTRNDSKAC
ncbi:MAG: MATE family efflux transporter [Clostridia bacterium]|nr:MATE family efflux transporter [Clostridia bacterium]